METIETDRLRLRNFRVDDAEGLLEYVREPRARCFLSLELADPAAAKAEAARRGSSDENVAIALAGTDDLIGDLFAVHEEPDTYSVGWNLNADHADAGFALKAAQALFRHLFDDRGARRLYAYVEVDNAPSRGLCERLGMRLEGTFVEFVTFTDGPDGMPVYEDTIQYAIPRREWDVVDRAPAAGGPSRFRDEP
ncbi:GNAT family protein [uncultured Aureimonas sp.]|uniref:GNAT family N-acetyltransferase n=1 Tax=uncultured Aureimonas sp. TaxID=1604662 RepID=UPI0025F55778|nr:GNAT family protein [uncultured Aureimonas sp.]